MVNAFNDHFDLFAKVIQASNDFDLLIMEKADKIYNSSYVFKYFNVTSKSELFNSKKLQDIRRRYKLLLVDLKRKSSWGAINV